MGIGATFGAVAGAITLEYYSSFYTFGIAGASALFTGIAACLAPDELETNDFALNIDPE